MRKRFQPALVLLALVAGCGGGRDRSDPPLLAETARFDAALASAAPDAERLAADADALSARAEALRARAAALDGPVLAPTGRDRLEAARP